MTRDEARRIMDAYSIRPSKDAGQNFLVDEDVAKRIVDASAGESNAVVEIGPGLGILTKYLTESTELTVGIEVSRKLCLFLSDRFREAPNFVLINADFLDFDIEELYMHTGRFRIVSNLPFNISKPAIARILRLRLSVESATLTVQQEVAKRITAVPGTKQYGVLSVMVAYWAKAEPLFNIGREAFFPQPRVDSTTVRLTIYEDLPLVAKDESLFQTVVRGAFSQRRKMLRNSLGAHLKLGPEAVLKLEEATCIDFDRRGETLSVAEFVRLADALSTLPP